ncbi:CNNM domain-containing protein [Halorussus gelatinilyticus]|uniref:CNNM domain-containing protein n=1 Tax=Halorussus gelatinilyticus TaxID=2937524 RepID=A0A8U0IG82_9EURY|nr:CNNM domain-containing protein [Halorussus gelatinilyticus]UPV99744.1 CNNM domain-containing protein [Halorussus gelatinilyticus]
MVEFVIVARMLGGIGLLLGNAYFVTIEFAMTRVRQFTEGEFAGARGLERAWEMTDRLEIYLSGCQLGITVCSVGLGVVAEPALAHLLMPVAELTGLGSHAVAAIAALAVINLMHVVVGEQAPTYLGIERTKAVAGYGSAPLYYWTKLMSPIIVLADKAAKWLLSLFGVEITRSWTEAEEGDEVSSRGDARRMMGDMLREAGLEEEREEEVLAALDIGTMPVRNIMVDREDIVPLSTTNAPEENLRLVRERPHTRFPLVGEALEDFRGIVYTPPLIGRGTDLVEGSLTWEEVAAEPLTVDADIAVSELVDRFQEERHELALVIDDGEVVGMVTATDAFEAMMGELEDPFDDETADATV